MNRMPADCSKPYASPKHMMNGLLVGMFFLLAGCCPLHSGAAAPDRPAGAERGSFSLTVAHLNDTHSHLEPTYEKVAIDGKAATVQLGGFARIATLANDLRNREKLLFLHAGDAFQGSLYFTKYRGRADWEMLNLLRLDAMTLGNHEFDRGPALVAELAGHVTFPVVAANVDAREEPRLAGKLPPYTVITYGGEKVGVIGLALAETAAISNPGDKIHFLDPVSAAQKYVAILQREGVNKVVVLSHNGYDFDTKLARTVAGIDVIVGGHSHTLLGGDQFVSRGFVPQGPYPTVVEAPDGKKVLVVTAWEWGKVLGVLDVTFDEAGEVVAFQGKPVLVAQDVAEDPAVRQKLEDFRAGLEVLARRLVAVAVEDLPRFGVGGRPVLGRIVADSMLWKARLKDPAVSVALQNAGGVRADIGRGNVSVGTVMSVLPFDNTLVLADLLGSELKTVLEESVEASAANKIRGSLIASGLRYTVEANPKARERVTSVQVRDAAGGWQSLDPAKTYRVVTNSFLASGGDFSAALKKAHGYRHDTLISDADAFIEYAEMLKQLREPHEPGTDTGLNLPLPYGLFESLPQFAMEKTERIW